MHDQKPNTTNLATFKLNALQNIAADPLMKPIDVRLFTAYTRFMKGTARMAYLPNTKARVLTGNASEPTISKSRARLVKHGYLQLVMTKLNGIGYYQLNDPRAEIVADHIKIADETIKEWDADRKARDRQKRKRTKEIYDRLQQEDQRNLGDTSLISYDNSSRVPVDKPATKGSITEQAFGNSYAAAKDGTHG